MRAGLGRREITPPMGVELAGYGYYLERRAQTVRDPLYARALILEQDGLRAMIVSCDLLGLSRAVCEEVFAHAETLGISRERVLILSIHTHTGPAIKYHEGCGAVCADYVSALAPLINGAADDAAADMDDVVRLDFACEPWQSGLIYNRTIPDGPVDRFARGFFLTLRSRPPIAAVSAACHGVFRGRSTAVSADFAGEICRLLEAEGLRPIYLNGLCGDIDPSRMADDCLSAFARLIVDTLGRGRTSLPLTLSGGGIPFELRLMPVTREDIRTAAALASGRAGGPDMPAAKVALIWEKEMLEKFETLSPREAIIVKYLLIGGVPVLALPFEGFTQIGMDLRRLCGRRDALVLGCAEELLGYLPTRDDIARGTYAALESTFLYKRLPVVPGEAERLGETLGRAMADRLAGEGTPSRRPD